MVWKFFFGAGIIVLLFSIYKLIIDEPFEWAFTIGLFISIIGLFFKSE